MVTTRPNRCLALEVAPQLQELAGVRNQLRQWLADDDVPAPAREDLALVVTELCTNAIEAAAPDTAVSVAASNDGEVVRLSVSNQAATGKAPRASSLEPGSLQERGRGLAIVQALSDSVTMSSAAGRTVVRTMRLL